MSQLENDSHKGLIRRLKQHLIAKKHTFFAIVQPGFEQTARQELHFLGLHLLPTEIEGGVEFFGDLEDCYRANVCSRSVSRIIMRIADFKAEDKKILRSRIQHIPWELYIKKNSSYSFSISARKSRLYHTGMIEEIFREQIHNRLNEHGADSFFAEDASAFSECNTEQGSKDQKLIVRIAYDHVTINIDSSGELLYKRGSKLLATEAPIRETIAAAILLEGGLAAGYSIIDPMCGSGTFTIEGLSILLGQYPNLHREFAFFNWPAFKPHSFNYIKKHLDVKSMIDQKTLAYTSDHNPDVVALTEKNITIAGFHSFCDIKIADFFTDIIQLPPGKKYFIALNPPYGNRLHDNVKKNYRLIGETIRAHYSACGFAIITPGVEYEKIMSLSYDKKVLFMNGGTKVAVIIKYCPE